MQTQQNEQTDRRKTFTVFTENGQRKPGLRVSFLRVMTVTPWDNYIYSPDGSKFSPVYEPEVVSAFKDGNTEPKCIVSFQVYEDGTAFAVVQLHTVLSQLAKQAKGN